MQVPVQGFERFPYQDLLKGTVFFTALIGFLIWGIYLVNAAFRRRQQMQMQQKLLEKFSTAHDFAEFMQSPAGQKYVMSFTDTVTSPRNSILNSIQIGLVTGLAGAGLIPAGQRHQLWFVDTLGMLMVCVGLGFLLSALVSYFLAKRIDSGVKE